MYKVWTKSSVQNKLRIAAHIFVTLHVHCLFYKKRNKWKMNVYKIIPNSCIMVYIKPKYWQSILVISCKRILILLLCIELLHNILFRTEIIPFQWSKIIVLCLQNISCICFSVGWTTDLCDLLDINIHLHLSGRELSSSCLIWSCLDGLVDCGALW